MERIFGYTRLLSTGAPAPLATVTVYKAGTETLATIYDDNLTPATAKSNPFTSDANGFFYFYAATGPVDVRFSGGGITSPYTWGAVSVDPDLDVTNFLAVGDNTTNDRTAIQNALDRAEDLGGGTVKLAPGKTYRITVTANDTALTVPDNVVLDLQQATLRLDMTGDCYGVRLKNNSQVINGTIDVDSTDGLDDSRQSIYQANVSVGEAYGANGTVASPSTHEGVSGWRMADLTLTTNREGGATVVVYGAANNGTLERLIFPDTDTARICIGFDPGFLGDLQSNELANNKTLYNAGTMYTTHPHHIVIRDITIGEMGRTDGTGDLYGSMGIRLSGCHHIIVDNVSIDGVTHASIFHTGSDIGFEYAPATERDHAYQGIVFRNITHKGQLESRYGAWIDTYGDNVWRGQYSQGYTPLVSPLFRGEILIDTCQFIGTGAATTYGIRMNFTRGLHIKNCLIEGWEDGVWFDENTEFVTIEGGIIRESREDGIVIGFALREPTNYITVDGVRIYGNGTDSATTNGINVVRGSHHRLINNIFGSVGEGTQDRGILIANDGLVYDCQITGNYVVGASASGFVLLGTSPGAPARYDGVGIFRDNVIDRSVPTANGGQTYLPISCQNIADQQIREWLTDQSSAPSEGTWYRGDRIRRANPAANTSPGWDVVTSGTFGTLGGLTNVATTNASTTVTMSLQSKTANTTISSYTIVFNDATNIRVGQKISIAAAGITNATLVSLSGTTGTLDTQANATTTGSAVVTAGVLVGEVISLDTTPAISEAVVKSISGSSVVLSTAASSTETGRTASYTTPVFKTHAALSA